MLLTPHLFQIVLASMAIFEVGFSHDIVVEWAVDTKNLVLFTERGQVCFDSDLWIQYSNLIALSYNFSQHS